MLSDPFFMLLSVHTLKRVICYVNPEDNALEHIMNFVILCNMFYSQTKICKITT